MLHPGFLRQSRAAGRWTRSGSWPRTSISTSGFTARGEVRFNDAEVSRQFNATKGEFQNDRSGEYALDCDGLRCGGDVFLNEGFRASGTVSLTGAEIGSELNCTAGSFITPGGHALFADGMTTPGSVYLDQGFRARGEVRFARATIGRQLVCTKGVFDNQHGTALDLTGLITPGDVLANEGFRATGEVRMRNADITRDLDFSRRPAARRRRARRARDQGRRPPDLETGSIPRRAGQPVLRPGQPARRHDAKLAGRELCAGGPELPPDHGQRGRGSAWTSALPGSARPGTTPATAYQQLAQAYRLSGQESTAEKVSIASLRDLRKRGNLRRRARAWNRFLDWTVGYGYRLHRPFLALLVLGLVGALLYYLGEHAGLIYATSGSTWTRPACHPGYPVLQPVRVLIPAPDPRPRPAPGDATGCPTPTITRGDSLLMLYTWLMIILGWVLATAVVAGITQLFRRR